MRAEREWRQVTIEMPRYRPGWRGLCEVLARAHRQAEALEAAEHCLTDPALEVEGRLIKGRLAIAAGDFESALAEVERATADRPADRAALEAKCQILFDMGPPSRAEEALRNLIHRHPDDASAHHNMGILLLRLRRYNEAASSFRQALRQRADAPATYLHLGYALKESGRCDEAVAAWQQVLRLEPNNPAARDELIRARQRAGPRANQPALTV